jgi:hypothetical protein
MEGNLMFIHLKVLDSDSGDYFETEAVLLGDGSAVYNDGGNLSVEPVVCVNGHYEVALHGKSNDIFTQDPSIIDRISVMAAEDYISLCE